MRARRALLACTALVLGGACGDDDDRGGATAVDPCDSVKRLVAVDDAFQAELREAVAPLMEESAASEEAFGRFRDVLDRLEEQGDEIVSYYDDLERSLDGELATSARTLGAFTEDIIDELSGVRSFAELQELAGVFGGDRAVDAVDATLRLDTWSQEECNVVLAD